MSKLPEIRKINKHWRVKLLVKSLKTPVYYDDVLLTHEVYVAGIHSKFGPDWCKANSISVFISEKTTPEEAAIRAIQAWNNAFAKYPELRVGDEVEFYEQSNGDGTYEIIGLDEPKDWASWSVRKAKRTISIIRDGGYETASGYIFYPEDEGILWRRAEENESELGK